MIDQDDHIVNHHQTSVHLASHMRTMEHARATPRIQTGAPAGLARLQDRPTRTPRRPQQRTAHCSSLQMSALERSRRGWKNNRNGIRRSFGHVSSEAGQAALPLSASEPHPTLKAHTAPVPSTVFPPFARLTPTQCSARHAAARMTAAACGCLSTEWPWRASAAPGARTGR